LNGLIRITRMKTNDSMGLRASTPSILEKELSFTIVEAFYEVYNELGFGFLESLYSKAMEIALKRRGLAVEREHEILVFFQGQQIGLHRLDLLVERRLVLEIKSTERLAEASKRQLRNYLTAMNQDLGILLHFGSRPEYHRVLGSRRPVISPADSA